MTRPAVPTHADTRRDEVDALVQSLPFGSGDAAFDEPWQLRAFALAVAAHTSGQYPWSDFQGALIASIKDWENQAEKGDTSWSYYEQWVNAVETVVTSRGLVDETDLDARTRQVLDTPVNRGHHEAHHGPVAVDRPSTPQ